MNNIDPTQMEFRASSNSEFPNLYVYYFLIITISAFCLFLKYLMIFSF